LSAPKVASRLRSSAGHGTLKVFRKDPLICRKPVTERSAWDSVGCSSLRASMMSPKASGCTSSNTSSASIAEDTW
jgi:hypothetical protein